MSFVYFKFIYLRLTSKSPGSSRIGEVKRVTKETNVHVKINLDGTGVADCSTGIPFLDHMLDVSIVCLACVLSVIRDFFLGVGGYLYRYNMLVVAFYVIFWYPRVTGMGKLHLILFKRGENKTS
jgi:hypothetical protein